MYWTTKTPTEIGWYWVRETKGFRRQNIVKIMKKIILGGWNEPDESYLCVCDRAQDAYWRPEDYDYEWAGPIEEPNDRPEATPMPTHGVRTPEGR